MTRWRDVSVTFKEILHIFWLIVSISVKYAKLKNLIIVLQTSISSSIGWVICFCVISYAKLFLTFCLFVCLHVLSFTSGLWHFVPTIEDTKREKRVVWSLQARSLKEVGESSSEVLLYLNSLAQPTSPQWFYIPRLFFWLVGTEDQNKH